MNVPKMLRNNVLVKVEVEERTEGGVYKPASVQEREKVDSTEGIVVACGKDVEECQVGDHVAYKSYIGNEIKDPSLDKKYEFVIVSENDVLAIFNHEK